MYDFNLIVPAIDSQKHTVDNRFKLLKNYLYELNEMLNIVLNDEANQSELRLIKTKKEINKQSDSNAVNLKAQSISQFNKLKEQIIRTAGEIQSSCKSEISKTNTEILSEVARNFTSLSDFGEYKNKTDTAIRQTADNISLVSENTQKAEDNLNTFKQEMRSEITLQTGTVVSKAEAVFQTKADAEDLENRVSSQIVQTENLVSENFSRSLSTVKDELSSVGGTVNELISSLDVYIRRGELEEGVYGIEIGRSDSSIKARFTNDRLSFYQGANEVAYISGSSLYITNADILDYMRIGNSAQGYFLFDTTSNGLEVRWINAN